jgi:putative long chain acyl-CoA synthase
VQERFKPARVLEFYASTEAGAILVNLSGAKPGAMGRPLPGAAEVRIAAYDIEEGLELRADGFARECEVDEVGMLLARVGRSERGTMIPLRSVFARDDAWVATGDLFRRDADGDLWRVDSLADVIHTATGPVFTGPIRDALGDLPAVDLAVSYGVVPEGEEHPVAITAVTLRNGHELAERDLSRALSGLPVEQRPAIVHVVDAIPVTTWFRPVTGPLRAAGIPDEAAEEARVWRLDAGSGRYARARPQAASRVAPSS